MTIAAAKAPRRYLMLAPGTAAEYGAPVQIQEEWQAVAHHLPHAEPRAMTDSPPFVQPVSASRIEQMFPKLSPAQIERLATHGRRHPVRAGEVLFEVGDRAVPFFPVGPLDEVALALPPDRLLQ